MGISVCAIANNYQESLVDTQCLFKKSCWELPERYTYLLQISSVRLYQDFRKVYVPFPRKILGQIQKIDVCNFRCSSGSEYDVDHFFALWVVDRIRVMMVQTCVPFVASVMIRIHSVIYPSFL